MDTYIDRKLVFLENQENQKKCEKKFDRRMNAIQEPLKPGTIVHINPIEFQLKGEPGIVCAIAEYVEEQVKSTVSDDITFLRDNLFT